MARGVNKVILIGNVGNAPEIRHLQSGSAVANFSIATSESWRDKATGEQQERTEWHKCTAYGKVADIIGQYVTKGMKLYVEGSLRTRKWQDQQGVDRYSTEINVSDMQMLSGNKGEGGGQQQSAPQRQQQSAPRQPPPQSNDFDDDIPF